MRTSYDNNNYSEPDKPDLLWRPGCWGSQMQLEGEIGGELKFSMVELYIRCIHN